VGALWMSAECCLDARPPDPEGQPEKAPCGNACGAYLSASPSVPFRSIHGHLRAAAARTARDKFAKDQLKAIIERIERLKKKEDDLRRHPARLWEARATASTSSAASPSCRMRKQDANERAEQETILETYKQAWGLL